jgi:hypothetical protein
MIMAGPYDYSINIPQPPAQNFLQSLMGIRQLQQMEEQSAISQQQAAIQQQNAAFQQQMQPLERQKLEAAIAAQRASAAHSGAATNLLGVQTTAAKAGLADKQLISSTLQGYANDKTKTIEDLIPILPLLDTTAVENIGKAEQIRVNREVDTALKEGKEITANDIRGWSNRQTLLKGPEQQQFQQSFLAMTPQFKEAAKTGMISAVNAAFAGNMGEARKAAAEVQQALINSKDSSPASKSVSNSFGKIVDLIDQNPNLPKEVLALNVVNAAGLIGEPKLAEETLKVYKEFGGIAKDQAKPEKPLPSSIQKNILAAEKRVDSLNEQAEKFSQAATAMASMPSRSALGELWMSGLQKTFGVENPELAIRRNAAQLSGLGMLGQESQAMGGAIRSNVQFQYATGKLPDAFQSPQELAKRLDSQAAVQRKFAKLAQVDAEWDAAFRGNPKAQKAEQIMGRDVAPGTTIFKFKEELTKELFPAEQKEMRKPASRGGIFKTTIGGKSITVEPE